MSASYDRGHFDGLRPSFRIQLFAQGAPLVQADLFTRARTGEYLPAEPEEPCEHVYDDIPQRTFDGSEVHLCVRCGASAERSE